LAGDFQKGYKMVKISWDDSLSIGVEEIDSQHKQLIEKLDAVTEAIEKNQGEGTIAQTLDFLLDYTVEHFSTEENFMVKHNYPDMEFQKRQHKEFKQSVNQMIEDFELDGASKEIADHIRDFLFIWLKKHIKEVDLPLAKFVSEKE
jgi:hemerythrin